MGRTNQRIGGVGDEPFFLGAVVISGSVFGVSSEWIDFWGLGTMSLRDMFE